MTAGRAEAYDRHTGRYGPELSEAFAGFAAVRPGMRVLDVGCGPGGLTRALAEIVGAERVAAVGPSEDYARACRRRVPGSDVRDGAAEALPFGAGAFDAVLSQLVVQALVDAPAGGEGAWWAAGEDVDEHREGEGEQALGDPLRESGGGLGEVLIEAHLALRLLKTDSATRRMRALAISTGGRAPSWCLSGVISVTPIRFMVRS
jgi:SAM-dependent methyltransferase